MRGPLHTIGEWLLGREASVAVRNRLMIGMSGLLSLRVSFGAMSFVLTVLLARTLGDQGFGTYSYALAWAMLLGAPAVLGMDQLLVREVAAYSVKSQWNLLRGILRAANGTVLIASVFLAAVAAGIAWMLRGRAAPELIRTFWVGLLLVPLISLTRLRQATLQGLHRVVFGSIPERLILPALFLAALAIVRVSHLPLAASTAMALNVAATGVAFVVGAWLLQRNLPAPVRSAPPAYEGALWARSAVPILLFSGAGVIFAQADILILGSLKGSAVVGLYGVADKSAELLSFVLVAQNAAFASTAATLYAQKDLSGLQRLTSRIGRVTLLVTLPLGVVFIGFGHWFLVRFYGVAFRPAVPALAVLSIGQMVNVASGLNGMLLIMTGHERDVFRIVGVSAAVNIGLNFFLITKWGMTGAAIANTSSLLLLNAFATIMLYRRTGIHSTAFGVELLRNIPKSDC
jgi:O-antigen/teichoic acid export membrane protein